MKRLFLLTLTLALAAACAPKKIELPPTPAAAKYPDYIFPAAPADLGTPAAQERHKAAWLWLQAGDLRAAERNFEAALRLNEDFYPAEAGLGYVGLAKKDQNEALNHFDRAVVANPRYAPALVGRGEALLALGQRDMALKSFEAAVVADANLQPLRSRIEVLRVRTMQDNVAAARKAAESGRMEDARRAYEQAIAASPESPFLYRELANVLKHDGDLPGALQQARKAADLEPTDSRTQVLIGEVLEAQDDIQGALQAYEAARALEPGDVIERKIDGLRERLALAALPSEFQSIETSTTLSRAAACRAGRRAARRPAQPIAPRQRRRHDRHARELGGTVDPVGDAGGRDGGLSESHVSAGRRRAPRGSCGDRQPCAVADCGGKTSARRFLAGHQAEVPRRLTGPSQLPGRLRRGRGGRHGDAP